MAAVAWLSIGLEMIFFKCLFYRLILAPEKFEILFEDEYFVAINKPPHILVHRTGLSEDRVFVLQLLRDQIGQRIYPIHRLDRATSGVLVFGKNGASAESLAVFFREKTVEKRYIGVVRGWVGASETIDYPLADPETGQEAQPAVTHFKRLGQSEIPDAIGKKYPTARFSLLEIEPETGRRQQIRKHLAHVFHPLIGDSQHGDVKHNKYFREVYGMDRMLLHAHFLVFQHPYTDEKVQLKAGIDGIFKRGLEVTGLMDDFGHFEV